MVIEAALMPIGLFHFHRAGVYGALANVIAIPLTTFLSMPLIALALVFDLVGAGAPFWWLAGQSLEAAAGAGALDCRAARCGDLAARVRPDCRLRWPWRGCCGWRCGAGASGCWGWFRRWPGLLLLSLAEPPDVMVSSDGRHVGVTGERPGELLVLRDSRSDFARDNLLETAGMNGTTRRFADWDRRAVQHASSARLS